MLKNEFGVGIDPNAIQKSCDLEDVEYYSEEQLKMFDTFYVVMLVVQTFLWILVGASGFLGSNYRMWKIIEVL